MSEYTPEEEAAYAELYPNLSAYRDIYNGRKPSKEVPTSHLEDK